MVVVVMVVVVVVQWPLFHHPVTEISKSPLPRIVLTTAFAPPPLVLAVAAAVVVAVAVAVVAAVASAVGLD